MVAASTRLRPNLSAIGPQISERPHPIRKSANSVDPANATLAGVALYPDFGSNSVSAGLRIRAKITESMPSSVQPAHAPQNPVICWRLSLVRTAGSGRATTSLAMGSSYAEGVSARDTETQIRDLQENSYRSRMTRTASARAT